MSAPAPAQTGRGSALLHDTFQTTTPHNLPAQPTALVGRNEDILAVRDALAKEQVRLVTLIGPAGVGKTRLALGVADCVLDQFPDGVFFVELAPLEDPKD